MIIDNIGIVVESIDNVIPFFETIGLKLEGRQVIEGEWAGRLTGVEDQVVEIAMLSSGDQQTRVELSQFIKPALHAKHRKDPVNTQGYLRIMFKVPNMDELLMKLVLFGVEIVGDVVEYQNTFKLCYLRGPEGILIGLAEEINSLN